MNLRVFALASLCVLAGCSQSQLGPLETAAGPTSSVQIVNATELPPPDRADLFAQSRPYLIGPFDKLVIDVFGIAELTQKEYQTDASGRISFPLAGIIEAAGKTPADVEGEIESRLRGRFIRDPQVTVNLRETVNQVITVDGEVREPGLYPVYGRMTLMRAVATAKGLSDYARQQDVVVFRTVQGKRMAALYNLKAIRRGTYDDPEVFASDVVVVGDSQSRKLFRDLMTVAPLLVTPLVIALQ
jgi:polysaccharide export outer membrane protein